MRPEDLGIGKLFERVRDAVIVADAETQRVVLWNPAATNIFGYTLSEALELRVEALVPEHLKALHRAGMIHYWETGHGDYIDSQRLLDLPALKKGGEEIRIELSLNPIVPIGSDGGRFVLAIVRDVTQRRRAEERLAEPGGQQELAFDHQGAPA
jgi:PAS domain S-box-containing protein